MSPITGPSLASEEAVAVAVAVGAMVLDLRRRSIYSAEKVTTVEQRR